MELLTARGRGGIAVVRALPAERERLHALLRVHVDGAPWPDRTNPGVPTRARLELAPGIADDVLVVDRGERGLEVHLHGSPVLLDLLARAMGPLVTPALSPARALLGRAISRAQVELALEQEAFDFDRELAALASQSPASARPQLTALLQRSRAAMALAVPARVVLCGRQNAGKSTLFNRLLFRERALAGPLAGLTRDAVAESTELAGHPVELVDTAGEGDVASPIDVEALRRSRDERARADLRFLVVDRSRGPGPIERELLDERTLVVATKCDLESAPWPDGFPCHVEVACLAADNASDVRARVGEALRRFRVLPVAGPVGCVAALDASQWQRLRELASAHGIAPA